MALALQPWEAAEFRIRLSTRIAKCLELSADVLAVPRNVVAHVCDDHPKDAPYLSALHEIVNVASHFEKDARHPDKYVLYSCFDEVWFRVVIVRSPAAHEPSIPVSLYRRHAAKDLRAIKGGLLNAIGEAD